MIKTIFFDFDGVFTLEGHACHEICTYLEPIVQLPADTIEPVFHNAAKQLLVNGKRYEDYIDSINAELGASLTAQDILSAIEKSQLNERMVGLLKEVIEKHDVQIGILTDNNIERLEMIRRHPIFGKLSPIVGSGEVGCTKSACEDIFTEALKQAKAKAEEAIFIDDKPECLVLAAKLSFNTYHHDPLINDVTALRTYLRRHQLI